MYCTTVGTTPPRCVQVATQVLSLQFEHSLVPLKVAGRAADRPATSLPRDRAALLHEVRSVIANRGRETSR